MDNLGAWAALSLPPFIVTISSLKGQFQNISAWAYLWSLGAIWSVLFWQSYQLCLSVQRIGSGDPQTLPQYILAHWTEICLLSFLMALPPAWYLRERRKIHAQTAR